ncbi:PREDICTED: CD209 antigen-like protein A [Priapulus caudatus]|uniref:CD209 antigen-like protein A n=1 Tax=Priapulus caudatus TaxID=37621 RepID=A0ABM1ERR4_PRICU|nr:PREDICTED: CD209 antigen-like protein A [Priapulus caudatus]
MMVRSITECSVVCARTQGCTGYNIEITTASRKQCELSAYSDTDVGGAIVTDNNYNFYTKVNSGECPADFVEFRGNCYYIETLNTKTWQKARDHCISMGADLVSLESPGETDFVAPQLPPSWWTGGNDVAVDTQWVWVATGRQVGMCAPIPWGPREPSGGGENYMFAKTSYLRGDDGGSYSTNYVCEKSP